MKSSQIKRIINIHIFILFYKKLVFQVCNTGLNSREKVRVMVFLYIRVKYQIGHLSDDQILIYSSI